MAKNGTLGEKGLFLIIALFLLVFLVGPVVQVFYVAFIDVSTGNLSLINFVDFFNTSLFMESFYNSFYVASMSVVVASIIALPLAYYTSRFDFKGSVIIQSLGFIPLIMPPFVGAVAMQLFFGENGSVNLFLEDTLGFKIPFMDGLNGVIFVQSIHYFPFILLNLSAALNNIDRSMEESAQNLGSSGFGLFRKIVFPLAMPGYIAGAVLVFIKVFDDLGTPLLLNVNNMLAPQAYLRISSIGIDDPMGYVIAVVLVVFSLGALGIAGWALKGKDYSTTQKGGGGLNKRKMTTMEAIGAYSIVIFTLLIVLSPHFALTLLSFATIWSYSIFPDAYTTAHYAEVFTETPEFITNTLIYASGAAIMDIILGVSIAYLVIRSKIKIRKTLDYVAMSALAVPGLVLAIGYLRTFSDVELPNGQMLASWWLMLVIALAVRRLPYALRACTAAMQQVSVSLEEASENLGASKFKTMRKITIPLMAGGILAGFVTSFATAAVELSATIMLISSESDAPLAYGIYIFMQSASGRGAGAALGIIAVVIVALGTYISYRFMENSRKQREVESKDE
ncbi:MAG: iron ABC transporter permease [Campylobacteraceae bacterium]|nr:iron ABC transporter permease [Campylobacteraceae bacterium]